MKCKKDNCKANALKNADGRCYQHSQKVSLERTQARQRGGRRGKRHIENIEGIETVRDIQKILSKVLTELMECDGNILPRSRCIGYLASVMLDCIEKADFEQKLNEMQAKIDAHIK